MERILVTGGAGFIGSHVCDALLSKGKSVICLDNFNDFYSPGVKRENISRNLSNKNFTLLEKDICHPLGEVFKNRIDTIIHLAARAGVRPSLEDPFIYEETNVKGTLNLLEMARQHQVKTFIFGSSSSVYARSTKSPFSEDDRTDNPISPYAATKKAGEALCHTYSYLYGLNVSCLRFFTVYGPRGRPDMAPYLFTKKILEGEPVTVFGDGTSRRDYTFVSDIVQGVISAAEKNFRYEVFNLGNSSPVELNRFIEIIEKITGKKAKVKRVEMPKEDVPLTYADISKSKKLLGYAPSVSIEEGMEKFISWYNRKV
jgi:UDP-glucuronate 4-epimerase